MITRIKELAYDNVAKKFLVRDPSGKKVSVPLGGSSVPYGKKFGRETTADVVVPIGPAVPFNFDGPYSDQDDIGLVWNAAQKRFDCADGGAFTVETGLSLNAQPAAGGGASARLIGNFTPFSDRFEFAPGPNNYGYQWLAAGLISGEDWTGRGSIVVPVGGSVQLVVDPTDAALTFPYAWMQFARIA
jgi:hypothetical protein